MPQLVAVRDVLKIRQHLKGLQRDEPARHETLDLLRSAGGEVGRSLADAFEHFPWPRFNWSVRALIGNASKLGPNGFSFRRWLREECRLPGEPEFPPPRYRRAVTFRGSKVALERALRVRLDEEFYMVGPALSAYMACDWQLWLWSEGRTADFATFKPDRVHERFVRAFGRGPSRTTRRGSPAGGTASSRTSRPGCPASASGSG